MVAGQTAAGSSESYFSSCNVYVGEFCPTCCKSVTAVFHIHAEYLMAYFSLLVLFASFTAAGGNCSVLHTNLFSLIRDSGHSQVNTWVLSGSVFAMTEE